MIGAAVGAYLGYRYGVKQEREKREVESLETKEHIVNSLLKELQTNSEYLDEGLFRRSTLENDVVVFQRRFHLLTA